MRGSKLFKVKIIVAYIFVILVLFSVVSYTSAVKVIIYDKANFQGTKVKLFSNSSDLRVPTIAMNDKVLSLKIKNASSVALFENINYKGKCQSFTENISDLRIHQVGILGISSIKINADCPEKKAAVILYEKKNYRGESKKITSNTTMLAYTPLHQEVSSIKLDGVSSVAVFSGASYHGNCEVFTSSQPNLSKTSIGDNEIESVKLNGNCRFSGPYMFLFEHNNYNGRRFRLINSASDLSSDYAGNLNNKVSSIKMFNMSSAALYGDRDMNGKCHTMKNNIPQMASTVVGNDALSSIRFNAECKEERFLKVRNNSAAVVKFSWLTDDPLHPQESVKLAVGREKIFNYKTGRKLNIIVYFGYPALDTASNFVDWDEKCSYRIKLDDNYFIFAKGTLIKPSCEKVIIPSI